MSAPKTQKRTTRPGDEYDWKMTLKGKVIAITGANTGIGLAVAQVCLANDAAMVFSLDISEPPEEYLDTKKQYDDQLHFIHCDVTSEDDVRKAIDEVVAKVNRIDGFVSNAGIARHHDAFEIDAAYLHKMFSVNVFAGYYCAIAAAKKFIELDIKGSIVFTASMAGYGPNMSGFGSSYGATKAALRNMAKSLAVEWAPHGIRVNCVCPGYTETKLTKGFEERMPGWEDTIATFRGMARMADAREIAGPFAYLLSDAATYVSGIDIPVAGAIQAWG